MNILIFMSGGFDYHGPSNHLFCTLIEDLLKQDHSVFLVQRKSGGKINELSTFVKSHKNFFNHNVSLKNVKKNRFIRRYLNSVGYSFLSKSTIKGIVKNFVIDIVLVQSNPTPYFQLSAVRRLFKGPIVYNVQDLFPGSTIAAGKMNFIPIQKFFYWLSRKAYNIADHLTVISEDSKMLLIKEGVNNDKISVILNWFNSEEIKEIAWEQNLFVRKFQIEKGKFYIQYAGGMGFVFDYMTVVNLAIKLLPYKDIVLLMIGEGTQKSSFVSITKKLQLINIAFYPLQPQSEISHVYSTCDIQLIPLKRGVIGNSVPSKAAILMACKRLIVNSVDEKSEYFARFNENNIGISVSNNDNNLLVKKILEVYNNPASFSETISNAYNFGLTHYARETSTKKYDKLFIELVKSIKKKKC